VNIDVLICLSACVCVSVLAVHVMLRHTWVYVLKRDKSEKKCILRSVNASDCLHVVCLFLFDGTVELTSVVNISVKWIWQCVAYMCIKKHTLTHAHTVLILCLTLSWWYSFDRIILDHLCECDAQGLTHWQCGTFIRDEAWGHICWSHAFTHTPTHTHTHTHFFIGQHPH